MENRKNYMLNYSKVKLLFLKDLLIQETDSEHGLTMKEIQTRIDHQYKTRPDRKTIIKDIDALEDYGGIEIQRPSGRRMDYRVLKGENDLDLMEIKLLIDTVQASRFLSQKQSDALVRKLEHLCSKYEKKKLYHKVIVPNRAKSTNRQILYVMDDLKRGWRKSNLPSYMIRILVQSVQAYMRKEYALTISALVTLWEGIIQEKANDDSYRVSNKTRDNLKKLIEENKLDCIFSSFCDEFILYQCRAPEEVKGDVPRRHAIAHCWYDKYPNRKVALNAIIFTDFLLKLEPLDQTNKLMK